MIGRPKMPLSTLHECLPSSFCLPSKITIVLSFPLTLAMRQLRRARTESGKEKQFPGSANVDGPVVGQVIFGSQPAFQYD